MNVNTGPREQTQGGVGFKHEVGMEVDGAVAVRVGPKEPREYREIREPGPKGSPNKVVKCKWVRVSALQAGRLRLLDNDGMAEPKPKERLLARSLPPIPN